MPRNTRNTKVTQSPVVADKIPIQLSIANVNKTTRSKKAVDQKGKVKVKAVKRKGETAGSAKKRLKTSKIPVAMAKKGKIVKRSLHKEFGIQEKYKNADVPKITIQGDQGFVAGNESPVALGVQIPTLAETQFTEGDQLINLRAEADNSFAVFRV